MNSSAARADDRIAAVIPCFRERESILDVIGGIGGEVQRIYVVDDACPDATGALVEERSDDKRVTVIRHSENRGVGAATISGMRAALADGADVIVKLDGDGQMDPALISEIAGPVLRGEADYAKGNRFHDPTSLGEMPLVRLLGNIVLSFVSKASSGYWNVFDPTNGFVAVHASVARRLPLDEISGRYFFESDMLHRLYLLRAVVADVPMTARYAGTGESKLSIGGSMVEFPLKHFRNGLRRLLLTYVLRDFNIASIELLLSLPLILSGTIFGLATWIPNAAAGVETPSGTVMLAALPIIIGVQMLLAFLQFDMSNVPAKPVQRPVS
ncbi:MAG: glycosyltransferase family 2 protein [Rhodospirillales bacterium]